MTSDNQSQQYNSFDQSGKKKKVPKRVLHFSDGILEEYSTDEEEREERRKAAEEQEKQQQVADPSTMSWLPWALYLAWLAATNTLAVCDSVGEKLAWWLGITSPKYDNTTPLQLVPHQELRLTTFLTSGITTRSRRPSGC